MRRPSWFLPSAVAVVVVAVLVALLRLSPAVPVTDGPVGTVTGDDDRLLALDSLRQPSTRERFYFVMTDRFADGDPANNRGGLTGGRATTGYDPTDKGFYHGGDLAGLRQRLDYIKGLGTTAIWLTPTFTNSPVSADGTSAGYHGYWVTDFTRIDPHLGTNDEMAALVADAHARGMKVFFDIITNHTADVIVSGSRYVSKAERPYVDAAGREVDDTALIGRPFPALDPDTAFPYPPRFASVADLTVKAPAWLNDPRLYHNRGDSVWAGESTTYGDFSGLDDLWTERSDVVDGMTDIYRAWADLGIDGFRIDTVKHVNIEFWQQFSPRILAHARAGGKASFFMFGEVYTPDAEAMARYTTTGRLQATLDFLFQARASEYVRGGSADLMRQVLAGDDRYTDADSNAYQLPIFLSNHDLGRVGYALSSLASGDELVARLRFAHELMFTFRGNPVVYYGDEQGLLGSGGDKDARQDMFATATAQYAAEPVAGAPGGSRDRYDPAHPLYRAIAALAELRDAHPALADGAMVYRLSESNVLAFSRLKGGTEYVVVANNASYPAAAAVPTYSPGVRFVPVYGGGEPVVAGADGTVALSAGPISVRVYRAEAPMPVAEVGPVVTIATSGPAVSRGEAQLTASLDRNVPAQVTFAVKVDGTPTWRVLATDDAAPYSVYADLSDIPRGTGLTFKVVAKDAAGRLSSATLAAVRD